MGIIVIKVIKRINSIIKKAVWKVLYLQQLKTQNSIFYPGTHITIEKHGKIKIGRNCFFNHGCSLNSLKSITIGNDCIFGENVKMYDHNHNYQSGELIRKQGYKCAEIVIGNNCWIGSDVVILPGVTIGDNVVIGAGTIVTKNIKNNSTIVTARNIKEL